MPKVLITRPQEDGLTVAETLKNRGLEPLTVPLFSTKFHPVPQIDSAQGLIITSKNALRAIEAHDELKELPLYAVGDQTAALARQFGFTQILCAGGNAQSLLQLVLKHADPSKGPLYYLSGDVIKMDLVHYLQKLGFQTDRRVVYSLESLSSFPKELFEALQARDISHCMFFSFKTAETFSTLLHKTNLLTLPSFMISLCLSPDVSRAIHKLQWKEIWISPEPSIKALIGYFDGKK